MDMPSDTIAAIATPLGEGGISIVRVSGPQALEIADRIFRPARPAPLQAARSHTVHYGTIVDGAGNSIDEAMVSIFRRPRSYTKEDSVEISTHGGVVVTKRVLETVLACGARPADPGEFTKRAFMNGRIDLVQAEAVLAIIKAKTDLSAQCAVGQLQGSVSMPVRCLKERLLAVAARCEAAIDFADQAEGIRQCNVSDGELAEIARTMDTMIASYRDGTIIREGVHTVLIGRPNVGKSSILNALLKRDRAIVSGIAGTTRDALEELLEIGGILFRVVDTAGIIDAPQHELDYLSLEKTRQHCERGDLILLVLDSSEELTAQDRAICEKVRDKRCLIVCNKCDLPRGMDADTLRHSTGKDLVCVAVSAVTKQGMAELEEAMVRAVWDARYSRADMLITHARHKRALEQAQERVVAARTLLAQHESEELVAYELHAACGVLRELIGEVYTSDLLDIIFSEFCIGK